MENFSWLTQRKDDYTTNSLTYTILFKSLGECTFVNLGLKGLTRVSTKPLLQNDSAKAISELIKCVYTKFEASPGEKAEQGGIVALSDYPEVAPDFPEPLALYKKLLSLPVPYKWKCPPLKEGVVAKNLGEEEVFLWLCFWWVSLC